MGKIISFSGIDGAGKSTQVKLLSEYLDKKGLTYTSTEAMFTYFLLTPLVRVLRSATKSPKGGPVTINKTNSLAKLWFVGAFIDIWLGYIFKVVPQKIKYNYVIADRVYIDIWANLLYYGYIPHWAYKLLIGILPQADYQFLFLVKPGTVRKREDDFPLSYYQEQSKIYSDIHHLISVNVINANDVPAATFAQIKKVIE